MFENFFKIAFRNLLNQKIYSISNILGLILGLTSAFIILLYILHENSYDRYHKNHSNIYRVVSLYENSGIAENSSSCPFPLAPTLQAEFPDLIESTVRFFNFQVSSVQMEFSTKRFNEKRIFFVDSSVFKVFDFELVEGNKYTALQYPYSIVITQSIAKKYFGEDDPIGKTMIYDEGLQLKVTGIMKDLPTQSHFGIDFLISFSTLPKIIGQIPDGWVWNPCWTYILLNKNSSKEKLNIRLKSFVSKYFDTDRKEKMKLELQPITEIHLNSNLDYEIERNNSKTYLNVLLGMVIFIIILSLINHVNLSIAGSLKRAKEICIKKIYGVRRRDLIIQFFVESIAICTGVAFLSLALTEIIVPLFNLYTGKNIQFDLFYDTNLLIYIAAGVLLFGIIAGAYPAFALSRFKKIPSIRPTAYYFRSNHNTRHVLLVSQFVIAIVLNISTILNISQFFYLQRVDLGFNPENIVILPVSNNPIGQEIDAFRNDLLKHSEIKSLTPMLYLPGINHNTRKFYPVGFNNTNPVLYPEMVVGYDFLKTFDIKLIAGRDFSRTIPNDNASGIIVNKSLTEHLGCKNPQDAIGKEFTTYGNTERIIGVINDFNIQSLHSKIMPLAVLMPKKYERIDRFTNYIAIRVADDKMSSAIGIIYNEWMKRVPQRPFEYTLLDRELRNQYENENVLARISILLTIISVIIAFLGIFGLTNYITVQRTKEIGIRKVMGSSSGGIIEMFQIEFFKMVLVACIFAWPVSWFIIHQRVKSFIYHVDLQLWMFVLATVVVLLVSYITVSIQAARTANANPVESLRYE